MIDIFLTHVVSLLLALAAALIFTALGAFGTWLTLHRFEISFKSSPRRDNPKKPKKPKS